MKETRRRGWILTAVAILFAVITGFIFFAYLNSLERQIGDLVSVVVAAEDIPARTTLTTDLLEVTEIPRQFVHDSYFLNISDLSIGFVSIADIESGQIIQRNMIDANAGLEPGLRAVSLAVDQVGSVGGNVRPGNLVDIVVSFVDGNDQGQTIVLFEQVKVLTVNSLLPSGNDAVPGVVGTNRFLPDGQLIKDGVVTLAMLPEDAAQLIYMSNFGDDVRLIIRRLDEPESPPVAPISIEDFAP